MVIAHVPLASPSCKREVAERTGKIPGLAIRGAVSNPTFLVTDKEGGETQRGAEPATPRTPCDNRITLLEIPCLLE